MGQTFRDLKVYQISVKLAEEVDLITTVLPKQEQFRVTDQILRSSRSVPANIAEGYARRRYKKDFIKFLLYSLGSTEETQVHLELIMNKGFVKNETCTALIKKYINLAVRIHNYIKAIETNS